MMGRFAIECDIHLSKDAQAIVFHDETLERLTTNTGRVDDYDAQTLCAMALKNTDDTIISLPQLLELVAGRVPLFIEIKSAFSNDMRLSQVVFDLLKNYIGNACVMSFDSQIVSWFLNHNPPYPVGLVAPNDEGEPSFDFESITTPDFLAWDAQKLPHEMTAHFKKTYHRPVITWTVRSQNAGKQALIHADQIIFENYIPEL